MSSTALAVTTLSATALRRRMTERAPGCVSRAAEQTPVVNEQDGWRKGGA
jgi:hypothetical protein